MTLTAKGENAEKALSEAEEELFRLDRLMNRHTETSVVCELNKTGTVKNAELAALLQRAVALSRDTDGAFDCTVAPLIDAWNISGGGRIPPADEIASVLMCVGSGEHISISDDVITLSPGTEIDLGAVGKGYAGERVRDIFTQYGVTGSLSLGGDNCLIGPKSADSSLWRVGLKKPGSDGEIIGILTVTDTFTVTSGSYERFFTGEDGTVYHHILDPKTGSPAKSGLVSVTVLTADGVKADALATAFFVMGAENTVRFLQVYEDVEAILIKEDGRILYSESLKDRFTPSDKDYTYETF